MQTRVKIISQLFLLSFLTMTSSCKKYLDKKSNLALVTPTTIRDLQSLLEFYERINMFDPSASEISADDYYLTSDNWVNLTEYEQRMYTWEDANIFPPVADQNDDWSNIYNNVYRANVVLENIDIVAREENDQELYNTAKGHALFLRAKSFWHVADIWTVAYDKTSAVDDLGIPLRLDPNFNKPSIRSNLQETYNQITSDLKAAAQLLPIQAKHMLRPSRSAAYGLLARVYLAMREYDSCFKYADLSLKLNDELFDYNQIPPGDFSIENFTVPEILYNSGMAYSGAVAFWNSNVDSNLVSLYSPNDLRRSSFIKDNGLGGYYLGNSYIQYYLFTGIATGEVLLMRAETHARKGRKEDAMNDLNLLLESRWEAGTFVPLTATTSEEALELVLTERRKELVGRGLRWMDIKRLNKEGRNIMLKRIINGQTYTLPPNSKKFALPIPEDVISVSGMTQNPR